MNAEPTWQIPLIGFGFFFAILLFGVVMRWEDLVAACLASLLCGLVVFGPIAAALALYQLVSG